MMGSGVQFPLAAPAKSIAYEAWLLNSKIERHGSAVLRWSEYGQQIEIGACDIPLVHDPMIFNSWEITTLRASA